MLRKNIIISSLRETFILSWKNKWLLVLIFLLQIIFFAVFSAVSVKYQTRILENSKSISDYISGLNMTDVSAAQDILHQRDVLGNDPLSISRNFNDIVKNFRIYMGYTFVLLVFFMSLSWSLTGQMKRKNTFHQFSKIFLRIAVVLVFCLGLIFSFFLFLLNIPLTEILSTGLLYTYAPFLIFSLALVYFMFISISIIHKTGLKNVVQKTLIIGLKKMHYILAVYLINIFLFGASIFLLAYYAETNIYLTFLAIIIAVLSFVFGRSFLFNVADKLIE